MIVEEPINIESIYYPLTISHPNGGFHLQLCMKRLEHPSNGEIEFHIVKRGMEREGKVSIILFQRQRIQTAHFARNFLLGYTGIAALEQNEDYATSLALF